MFKKRTMKERAAIFGAVIGSLSSLCGLASIIMVVLGIFQRSAILIGASVFAILMPGILGSYIALKGKLKVVTKS